MSRIHEALKKAAQDRATQSPTAVTADLVDGAAEINRHIEPPDNLMRQEAVRVGTVDPRFKDTGILTYEELIKRCTHPKWTLDARNSVFVGADSDRVGAERFRTLRSRLYQIAGTQQLKKLLITSSIPAEGKTFVAANLAQSIVRQPDRRVLLVDADLRASRLHQTLGAPSGPGLSDYLRGEVDEYAIIRFRFCWAIATTLPNVMLRTASPQTSIVQSTRGARNDDKSTRKSAAKAARLKVAR